MKDFTQAIGLGIQNLDPYIRLIKWHSERGQAAAALIVTDQIIAKMPENAAGADWDKGKLYEKINKKALAIAANEASLAALGSDNADFADVLNERIAALKN